MFSILLTLVLSIIFAELCGYVIHVVLHSQKIEYLSRNHMLHHLKVYGPTMPQRPDANYRGSVEDRAAVLGVGMEWLGPIGLILAIVYGVSYFLAIPFLYTNVFTAGALGWGYFLFGYMHDNMHLKNFWMERAPLIKNWFLNIRKLHDIHHLHVDNDGKMNVNYGICFFFFDKVFNSYKKEFSTFNKQGHLVALSKYDYINK